MGNNEVKMPRVSVIIPTYRRDPWIVRRSIGSVLLQTIMDWECVICSDGEREPEIDEMVSALGDSRVRYVFTGLKKKDGDYGNIVRMEMLGKANGEYVLFLDDDNVIFPMFMEKMVEAAKREKAAFSVCQTFYVYARRWGPKLPIVLWGKPVKSGHIDYVQMLVRKDVAINVGLNWEKGYNTDGDFAERLVEKYDHVRVEEVLCAHL